MSPVEETDVEIAIRRVTEAGLPFAADLFKKLLDDNRKLKKKLEIERKSAARLFKLGTLPPPPPLPVYEDAPPPDAAKLRAMKKRERDARKKH